ncbi:NTF2-like protein [Patellaria atrata CBS 101060]|uniref:NTF2-like protein n=1 Tax=Patellaria atrata CBS 101060 TaxID=1346257 RepID=A0A9P4SIZ0_9PEZI|nr:NTF2-like protein [Patellaria atrata CBS 101060]
MSESSANDHIEILIKTATETAESFVDAYYTALQASRPTISSYYVPRETLPDGKIVPIIVWNGNSIETAAAFQEMFEKEMPFMHYEVQALDCHVMNPGDSAVDDTSKAAEKKISIIVAINGFVRLAEAREGPTKGFSESIVLAPNPEKALKGPKAATRAWLIQSQVFRYVV